MLTRYIKIDAVRVTALDAPTYALSPLVPGAIVLLASLGPARRATQVDPLNALQGRIEAN